jgi:hypothetical protein
MRRVDILLEPQIACFLCLNLLRKFGILWGLASRLLKLSRIHVVDALIS